MPDLSAMLKQGPVVCAEGYLFECERRGYLQAGAFVPEVVLDHPEVVEGLHREFVHAGSDVVEAFTYYGHRQKLRVIGKEQGLEPLNRQALTIAARVARETGTLLAGNLSNSEKLRRLNLFGGAVVTLLVVKQAVDAPAPGTAQPCTCDACGRSTVRCARTAPTWTHGSGRRSAASGWCETVTHEILMERRGLYRDIVERQRHSFGDLAMIQE